MNETELTKILSLDSALITAPAGHGKTEMIADMVNASKKRQLVLTHTNAGVDAIINRFRKKKIKNDKYEVTTIAGFIPNYTSV